MQEYDAGYKAGHDAGVEDGEARERERCAKIADKFAEDCKRGSPLSSAAEDAFGVVAAVHIAAAIRRGGAI